MSFAFVSDPEAAAVTEGNEDATEEERQISDDNFEETEEEWIVRWADEEDLPLVYLWNPEGSAPRNVPVGPRDEALPPQGILVGNPPGTESIDWEALFKVWDYDDDPRTPSRSTLVGPLSAFQEVKKAMPPKVIYGVVLLVLLMAALVGPITAAKNTKIADKRRQIAHARKEVTKAETMISLLQEENAKSVVDIDAISAFISYQEECLASLSELKGAVYPETEVAEQSSPLRPPSQKIVIGPEWGMLTHPTEVRLRMIKEYGDSPDFVTSELSRLVEVLEAQQKSLDKREQVAADSGVKLSDLALSYKPVTEDRAECKQFLCAAKDLHAALKTKSQSQYDLEKARQLVVYGVLLQRQQEIWRDVTRFQERVKQLQKDEKSAVMQLRKKRAEVEESISIYIRATRDTLADAKESKIGRSPLWNEVRTYFRSVKLGGIADYLDELHRAETKEGVDKLTASIARKLVELSSLLPGITAQEASLLSQLGALQAKGSPEEQLAAAKMTAACESIAEKRDHMLEMLSVTLSEASTLAVQSVQRREDIQEYKNAVSAGLEAINGMKHLIDKAKTGAMQAEDML